MNGYHCRGCKVGLTGKARSWCDACRPDKSNRKTLAKIALAAGDTERAEAILRRPLDKASKGEAPDLSALQLAAALSLTKDVAKAARMAGLPEGADLQAIEAEARAEYSDVIEAKTEGFQRIGFALVMQCWVQLMAQMHKLPPGQLSPTAKGVMDVLEKLQTSVSPTFSDFNLQVVVTTKGPASD